MWQNHSHLSKSLLIILLVSLFYACANSGEKQPMKEQPVKNNVYTLDYPFGFDTIHFPKDNQLTSVRIALGKKIFFDTQFSADKKISCGSCHKPQFAFADTVTTHKGAHDSTNQRNSPSLINIGFHPYFDYDGGVPTIELQVLVPFDGQTEMNSNLLLASALMNKDNEYIKLSKAAYNRKPDPFVIVRALASYQRSLISTGSRYDLYKKTNGKKGLNSQEIEGMKLFFSSKTNCSKCHNGPLLTNFAFENIGVPNNSNDSGRIRVTINSNDWGKFKTPGLRNVSKTYPYMHDGSIQTLDQVVEFYNKGGIGKRNKSTWIKPLGLNQNEKKALVLFLNSLSDTLTIQ